MTAAVEADWGTAALESVRGMRRRAGPCGGLGGGAGWAGPRSATPAWGRWCAAAGRVAAGAGCGSGSCVVGGEARHSAETAEKTRRRFMTSEMCIQLINIWATASLTVDSSIDKQWIDGLYEHCAEGTSLETGINPENVGFFGVNGICTERILQTQK